ncbi:hypothetical protein THAR02_08321 [Trichoderma harzianum]|uniref:Uncharacterized protein n=1 Tax=Trichoderma harzianum TaxID=5544 RepID=A0A0F9XG73_TRIHA|nr:hypothetical protein THAR02_08321 [Trichoderma harzianum]
MPPSRSLLSLHNHNCSHSQNHNNFINAQTPGPEPEPEPHPHLHPHSPQSTKNVIPKTPLSQTPPPKALQSPPKLPQSRPRADSDTLPSNSHQLKNLKITQHCRIQVHEARDGTPGLVQYWIRADYVLSDRLKDSDVPKGHWPKLVELAEAVCGDRSADSRNEVRMLTAFYSPDDTTKVDMKVESLPMELQQ